jgi:hypothetical protein
VAVERSVGVNAGWVVGEGLSTWVGLATTCATLVGLGARVEGIAVGVAGLLDRSHAQSKRAMRKAPQAVSTRR